MFILFLKKKLFSYLLLFVHNSLHMRKSFLFLPLTKYVSSLAKSLEIEAYITTNVQVMPMNLEFYLQYKSDYISIKLHLLICYSK